MAARDLSKTFEEFESEDLSLETSVPTDFTMSPEPNESKQNKRQITKHLIERKQLIHDLQLLRIELSQKNLAIENMKAESIQRVDELEEKLNDALHQKQILQARLESQLAIQEEDAKKRQDMIKHELLEVRQRQQQLESANNRLREKAGDVMKSLKDLNLSEEKFYELRGMKEDELSLRDYVAVRLFEQTKPLQTEIDQLRMRNKSLDDGEKSCSKQMIDLQEQLAEERQQHGELRVKFQKISLELAEIKSLVKTDNYKVENYDRVKIQRDNFESDQLDVTRQLNVLEAAHQNLLRERDELQRELSTTRQSLALIKQDKDYLSRQICDVSNKSSYTEEKLEQLNRQLEDAKRAREEMYDKYVTSRDEYKREYENKLQEELDNIRIKTNAEIDRLRTSTKEMYERENRNLREARDMAISEKEKMQATERETTTKYEQLLNEFRQLQMAGDSRVVEIQNDLKIKTFEYERAQMVYEEAMKNLKETQIDMEKMQKKNEVLTKEYYHLQTALEKKLVGLEAEISDKTAKLQTYERLEQELDDVVMQAAEVENEADAEKVLFSYGYGANVPSNSKRRLQQSVHLARRVIQLEKANTSLRQEINREKTRTQELADEIKSSNELLNHAEQPYNYLIDSIRVRDQTLNQQKQHIRKMEEDIR
ncbi:hypothetical protein SNE40_017265 [Patella caerulea]